MHLDHQIDEVARELIAPEPDVRLRPLVVARLSRRPVMHPSAPFVPVAVAVALLLLGSSAWLTTAPSRHIARDTRSAPIERTTGAPKAIAADGASHVRAAALPSAVVPDTGDLVDEAAVEPALPALATPATLSLQALEPEPLTVPLLGMTSVEAVPIDVTPVPAISPIRGLVPIDQS